MNTLQQFKRYNELLIKRYEHQNIKSIEREELDQLQYKLGLIGVPEIEAEMNLYKLEKMLEKFEKEEVQEWKK